MEVPETWAWDEHDMFITDDAVEQAATRHAEVVKAQVDSFGDEYLVALYTSDSVHLKEGK